MVGIIRIRTHATIARVLVKLGIDPHDRFDSVDQDAEYTACRADELPQYFELYRNGGLSDEEKCVLCCFLIEGLNEIAYKEDHQLHDAIFNALFDDEALHKAELDYWMDTDDPDEANWWPITKGLLRARKSREVTREK